MASESLFVRDSLTSNPNVFDYPTTSDINITSRGAALYWAISAVMGVSALLFIAHGHFWTRPRRGPGSHYIIFHYITAAICFVACIAYFTMASNLGYAAIAVEYQRSNPKVAGVYREIFYVRYIDWVITTPLLLLDVLLTSGLPWPIILFTILADEIMIVTGLVGALVSSQYKWGYFVFAMLALFFVFYQVSFVGHKSAKSLSAPIGRSYLLAASWTMLLWFIYPVAWGLSEGGNVISGDSEAIFYSILDVLAKPGFGAILLYAHKDIDPSAVGIHIRDYTTVRRNLYTNGASDREKLGHSNGMDNDHGVPVNNNGVNNDVHNNEVNKGHSGNGALPANGTQRPANAAEGVSTSANHGTAEPRRTNA